MTQAEPQLVCKNCANRLARWCYQRHGWFRLIREPLLCGLHILAWWHDVPARPDHVENQECRNCLRFRKTELEAKSPLFRFLNRTIGKKVNTLRDSLLTQDERDEAKRHAREMMEKIHR
ncbi:MAG TPA: nitroreductase [Patescibacteria group bacterium]|nr:nitroreductase [Patescibacteria group bacterium]